jgi:hypothetical protein
VLNSRFRPGSKEFEEPAPFRSPLPLSPSFLSSVPAFREAGKFRDIRAYHSTQRLDFPSFSDPLFLT